MSEKQNETDQQEDQMAEQEENVVAAEAEATAEGDNLQAKLAAAEAKAQENWDHLLRTRAEMDNLRRRTERELENAHKYALERFSQELLPVKDSLEMGINAAQGETIDPVKLKEGTSLTLKMLADVMERFGIVEIDPQGQRFNPEFHDAISIQERTDVEPNTVVTVVQKGYALNDRLIRPAMVIVAQGAPSSPGIDEKA